MPQVIEGKLNAEGVRIGIVIARFNEMITSQLLKGAEDAIVRHGGSSDDIQVVWVPGSFEIPIVAAKLIHHCDAVICLGALIRGATSHYDHLASSVTGALQHLAVEQGVPVINGVLTTENIEQAVERAGAKAGNKGYEAAVTAIEMVSVLRQLEA